MRTHSQPTHFAFGILTPILKSCEDFSMKITFTFLSPRELQIAKAIVKDVWHVLVLSQISEEEQFGTTAGTC